MIHSFRQVLGYPMLYFTSATNLTPICKVLEGILVLYCLSSGTYTVDLIVVDVVVLVTYQYTLLYRQLATLDARPS